MDLKQLQKMHDALIHKIQKGYGNKNHMIEALILIKSFKRIIRSKTDGQDQTV